MKVMELVTPETVAEQAVLMDVCGVYAPTKARIITGTDGKEFWFTGSYLCTPDHLAEVTKRLAAPTAEED